MSKPLLSFEDFGQPGALQTQVAPAPDPAPMPSAEELESQRMASYEQGYKAGWDDAVRSHAEEQSRISADFARNLEDLGFTFHEARSHVMSAMEPLLQQITAKVLPQLVSETLGQTIMEELMPLAEKASDHPIQVVIPPQSRAAIEKLAANIATVPLDIVEEPSLAEGQVYLRLGTIEKHIDMSSAVDRIGQAISAIFEINEKALTHG
ncbi:hypothetical protein AQS8620_00175 [Aquimixticola soesokkakensis]|uniref:Flagellar assembly protein H n=1 Tax=Aquimixticola soesokkakensis TaxID=1519096 RepID=A0A1Y5RB32_9RHOB|nr:flagellar biosynthesis protein [Aquimixticola soesokkakensis]SLN13266.1 hypothetical protein AQS8620_00175 [Aquimixticola soesokkakensis]